VLAATCALCLGANPYEDSIMSSEESSGAGGVYIPSPFILAGNKRLPLLLETLGIKETKTDLIDPLEMLEIDVPDSKKTVLESIFSGSSRVILILMYR